MITWKSCAKYCFGKKGFTLAELLTAVLVISVIMVALAPVITKRMKESISVQTDNKKGLEIYPNPGTYTFDVPIGINTLFLQGSGGGGGGGGSSYIDKDATFLNTTTWTVPKGVNQITFTLYGAGGGGGGGYGKTGSESCPSPYIKLPNMADNGRDLCYWNKNLDSKLSYGRQGSSLYIAKPGESTPSIKEVCYRYLAGGPSIGVTLRLASGSIRPEERMACSPYGANSYCNCYLPSSLGWQPLACGGAVDPAKEIHESRLIKTSEMQRIINASPAPNFKYLAPQYLDIYAMYNEYPTTAVTANYVTLNCPWINGTGYCHHGAVPLLDGTFGWTTLKEYDGSYKVNNGLPYTGNGTTGYAGIPICVYEIRDWTPYGGSGGASGAKYTQTISVLPSDTLEITIGTGGNGGSAGGNGSQGGATKIVHKRGAVVKGTYYANGGVGGNRATTSGVGAQTSVLATCSSASGCSQVVSTENGKGYAGTETTGGKGAGEVEGGTPDANPVAAGNNTSYGGGGGFCPRGSKSASSCQKGAKGGSGKVEISYRVMLGGSGGGSGARVGGVESSTNKDYEIKYKVAEGDRIVFEVGSGGSGGSAGQDGLNGTATIIGDNKIVFLAGEGGKAASLEQKEDLSNCIGSSTNSTVVTNCVNDTSYRAQGGKSGVINQDGNIQTTTLGLLISESNKVSYSVSSSSFKGRNGNMPSQVNANVIPWNYGFDGGVGGAPFGVRASSAAAAVTCGGGMSGTYGTLTDVTSYLCTSGNVNGNSGRVHDVANNEFGGSGGGGAGAVGDSFEQGSGGSGSNGYLRIRWDASEQE